MPSNTQATPQAHPVRGIVAVQRRSITGLAKETGYSGHHLNRVFLGHSPASPALREAVSRALGLSEDQLFHPTPPAPRFPGNTVEMAADDVHGDLAR
jgi:hypothetical protein